MILSRVPLFLAFLALAGCVNSSPDFVLSDPGVVAGAGANTGQTPNINTIPQGQTAQISPAEAAATKQQLAQDSAAGQAQAQAAKNGEAAYRAEVAALQKLAEEQRKRRLQQIESRQY